MVRLQVWALCAVTTLSMAWSLAAQERPIELKQKSTDELIFQIDSALSDDLARLSHSDLQSVLQLRVGEKQSNAPAMSAEVRLEKQQLLLKPRFPLLVGQAYCVRFRLVKPKVDFSMTLPAATNEQPPAKIEAIYPSSSLIPENTLKFYVHFSEPMRKGDVYRYVQIREVGGDVVELPFLELEQELWSRDSKRLTLLLDPGRIKRGLKPREEMGPIFKPDREYELVVSGEFPDHTGRKIGEDFVKKFRAGQTDEVQPNPKNWQFEIPTSNSREPLSIKFPEPLDHSMLERVIQIESEAGQTIAGKLEILNDQRVWRFVPERAWLAGNYKVVIENTLEDLAGNSIEKVFDVDVFRAPLVTDDQKQTRLPIPIK